MTCPYAKPSGKRIACHHPQIRGSARYLTVHPSRCGSCAFNPSGSGPQKLPEPPLIQLSECVHRGGISEQIPCGCAGNPRLVDVNACAVHGQCVATDYDLVADKLKGRSQRPKACSSCSDIWIPELNDTDILYCHYNPCGFRRPVENVFRWWDTLGPLQRITWGLHLVFDDNEPQLPNSFRIKATEGQRYFIKEAMVNYMVRHSKAEYVAWVDADLTYTDHRWIQQGIKLLDRYKAVQLWERLECPVPDGFPPESPKYSAASKWVKEGVNNRTPGGAWIMRRETFEAMGGLPEHHLTGGGDSVCWSAWLQEASTVYWDDTSEAVRREWEAYRDRCRDVIGGSIGYVPATATHLFHGTRKNRRYMERTGMLADFDPGRDMRLAENGLPEIINPTIASAIRDYLAGRDEDELLTVPAISG